MDKRNELLRQATTFKPIRLGQPPWSEEELIRAYFRNLAQTKRMVESRPGAKYAYAIESLGLSVAIFKNAVQALFDSIEVFREKSREPNFHSRVRRSEQEHYQLAVRRNLFSACSVAMALVWHAGTVQEKLRISGYQHRVDQDFKNRIDHMLIQGLRNCLIHKRLLPADWRTTIIFGEGQETRFFLEKNIMLSYRRWPSRVKEYLKNIDYGVDLEELFLAYRDRVDAFHAWYRDEIVLAGDWVLKEYLEYQRIIKGISWRSSWQILLQCAKNAKIDPLEYLNEYLFPDEIEYVMSGHDLKEHVDRIIKVLDEYKACDDVLRSGVYQLFGVDSKKNDGTV